MSRRGWHGPSMHVHLVAWMIRAPWRERLSLSFVPRAHCRARSRRRDDCIALLYLYIFVRLHRDTHERGKLVALRGRLRGSILCCRERLKRLGATNVFSFTLSSPSCFTISRLTFMSGLRQGFCGQPFLPARQCASGARVAKRRCR